LLNDGVVLVQTDGESEALTDIALTAFGSALSCQDAPDFTSLIDGLRPGFEAVGFGFFSVMEAITDRGQDSLRPIVGHVNEPWQQFYRENQLQFTDLRIRRARISARGLFCSEVLRDDPKVTPDEREFWVQASAYGLHESYVLPHRTAGGRIFAAILIGGGRPIDAVIRVATQMMSFEFICAALRLTVENGNAPKVTLSQRQIQCLHLLAAGKSSAAIAHELGISHRTVDHYVGAVCAKLKVRSRAQAVATAIGLQLLDQA
jgi:DNA-binding CsgD family transcriptional regulator